MKRLRIRIVIGVGALAIAAVLAGGAPSTGQEPAVPPPREIVPMPDGKKETDPTLPGPGLRDILVPKDTKTVQPKAAAVRLKGRVISKQSALVILDIDGANYILRAGGEARSVRVLEIATTGVKVEVGVGARKEIRVLE
jgi:hypothetical protein